MHCVWVECLHYLDTTDVCLERALVELSVYMGKNGWFRYVISELIRWPCGE